MQVTIPLSESRDEVLCGKRDCGGISGANEESSHERRVLQRLSNSQSHGPTTDDEEVQDEEKHDGKQQEADDNDDVSILILVTKQLWSDDKKLVEAALTKLGHLCSSPIHSENFKKYRTEIHETGGHAAILGVLTKFSASIPILMAGMSALANSSVNNDDMKSAVGKVGGIEKVIELMEKFADNQDIQTRGCATFQVLIRHQENAHRFVYDNGLAVIVNAMRRYPQNVELQRFACMALRFLCKEGWISHIEATGAPPAVAIAYAMHYNNKTVQKVARPLLKLFL